MLLEIGSDIWDHHHHQHHHHHHLWDHHHHHHHHHYHHNHHHHHHRHHHHHHHHLRHHHHHQHHHHHHLWDHHHAERLRSGKVKTQLELQFKSQNESNEKLNVSHHSAFSLSLNKEDKRKVATWLAFVFYCAGQLQMFTLGNTSFSLELSRLAEAFIEPVWTRW